MPFHGQFLPALLDADVFDRLYNGVWAYDDYFIWTKDVVERIGFSSYQKCTATLRMLVYGTEYLRMSESTRLEAMVRFATTVIKVFGSEYLAL